MCGETIKPWCCALLHKEQKKQQMEVGTVLDVEVLWRKTWDNWRNFMCMDNGYTGWFKGKRKRATSQVSLRAQFSVMEADGVRGQARVTFRGVPTAVPTGCCQATVGPDWPLSALRHLPTPISPDRHTFASRRPDLILLSPADRTTQYGCGMWGK